MRQLSGPDLTSAGRPSATPARSPCRATRTAGGSHAPTPSHAPPTSPRRDGAGAAVRTPRADALPRDTDGWWVARAGAVPPGAQLDNGFVWGAGPRPWARLAARGIWVHCFSDGPGATE